MWTRSTPSLAGDASVLKKDVKSMYKLGRKLGKGAYAVVHRGTLLSDKPTTRAVKIIDERACEATKTTRSVARRAADDAEGRSTEHVDLYE